jgi:hypothetical protein
MMLQRGREHPPGVDEAAGVRGQALCRLAGGGLAGVAARGSASQDPFPKVLDRLGQHRPGREVVRKRPSGVQPGSRQRQAVAIEYGPDGALADDDALFLQ